MGSLIKIAWRNCWRGRTRTLIVISSIVIGIWGSLTFMGFMDGLVNQRLKSALDNTYSHIQIQSDTYDFDRDITNTIIAPNQVIEVLETDTNIIAFSTRFITEALIQTAREQRGTKLIGVDESKEIQTLGLHRKIVDGTFLGDTYKRPILIGKKMAENLKVKIGSKILVTFTNIDSVQVSENYRVSGIYQSGNTAYDEYHVFVPKKSIKRFTKTDLTHQIIVKTNNEEHLGPIQMSIQSKIEKGNKVNTWRETDPMLAYGSEMYDSMLFIIMGIIIAGLLFGIVNTIVMSILERKREIGVLLAIGMNRNRIRIMIALESMFYGLIGGPIGVFLGYICIAYFHKHGLDLSAYSEGMMEYGMDPVIYFGLPAKYYFTYGGLITLAAFLGGLYPANMATRLNPIDAIRSI